ncbi:MAG: FAD-binding oxidoreductase [Hyphomicrobiales bacterium]|nr:FAD-binding oxidoreductase [Hyphomicrobiales bacterium]
MSQQAIQEIKEALGPRGWLEGEDMATYAADIRGTYKGEALLVARPASTEEVSQVVKICRKYNVCIVPQSGNTGLVGGGVPNGNRSTIILSVARMNKLISVDPLRYSVTAEAGCIVQTIHDAAADVDRAFSLDWGARGSAMIGGAISTNAGGINVLRFGNTRDQVLGLEVVLPDGRIWNGMRALRKDSSGYDLKHLFIGAEGTLGIVTKAVMRLHPRPERDQTMFAAVADADRLMELFALARAVASDGLTAFELVPGHMVEKALAKYDTLRRPLETKAEWYVMVRFSGREEIEPKFEMFFEQAMDKGLITDASLAQNMAQEQNLWDLRDEIPPLKLMEGKMLKWDTSVPIDRIIPFLKEAEEKSKVIEPHAKLIAFGHVGDGNLHMSVWPEGTPGDPEFDALCKKIVSTVDELIFSYGGSICAEHGVGVENFERVSAQKSDLEFEMMANIKRLFDPDHLMNPGKIFDPDKYPPASGDAETLPGQGWAG